MKTYQVLYRYTDGTLVAASVRTAALSFNYIAVCVAVPYARVWSIVEIVA